jgi:hypothetical protein
MQAAARILLIGVSLLAADRAWSQSPAQDYPNRIVM